MTFFRTLRARFALWTMGLLFAALVLFGLLVYSSMHRSLMRGLDEKLRLAGLQLNSEAEVAGGEVLYIENLAEYIRSTNLAEEGFSVQIFTLNGQMIQGDGLYRELPPLRLDLLTDIDSSYLTTIPDPSTGKPLHLYAASIREEDVTVGFFQVVQNLESVNRTLNLLLASLFIGGPLIIVFAGIGGYFLAGRALAPINTITRTARELSTNVVSANTLSARLNLPETNDEVGRLAATFDLMLAKLEVAFRRERQFTADASHELRTPLSAIKTIIDSTLSRQRTIAEYEQALVDLGGEADQMKTMAEGLLDLARHESLEQTATFETVDLSVLLKDLIESVRPVAEEKHLQIVDKVASAPLLVNGDSDELIRLFLNLLDNAIKYSDRGLITVKADSGSQQTIVVEIKDTGQGIPADALSNIFDRFYQVDQSRSRVNGNRPGVGLGLPIARRLAQRHGGDISVASQVGQGATFTVQINRQKVG